MLKYWCFIAVQVLVWAITDSVKQYNLGIIIIIIDQAVIVEQLHYDVM